MNIKKSRPGGFIAAQSAILGFLSDETSGRSAVALRKSIIIAVMLAMAGCDNVVSGPADRVDSITVSPSAATMTLGETRALEAILKTAEGRVLESRGVTWTSGNEAVATVTSSGMVTAVGAGNVVIKAASGTTTGQATLTIQQPAVHEVVFLQASPLVLVEGASGQLIAIPRDASGGDLNGYVPTWSTSDESIVWVTDTGGIVAGRAGTAQVTATVADRSATLTIEVRTLVRSVRVTPAEADLALNGSTQLSATALDAAGQPLGRTFAWESLNPAVATVDAAGRVTARQPGVAQIRATVAGISGVATVRVGTVVTYSLQNAEGRPVPAHLYTSEIIDEEGIARTVEVYAVEGQVRTLNELYQQSVRLEWYLDGVRLWTVDYADRGRLLYDFLTGELIFSSETYAGLEYRGALTEGGTKLSINQTVDGDQRPFTFTFARQQ